MSKKEMKEVLENCSDTQRKITDGWDTSSKEKGYLHNHSIDLPEISITTDPTIFSKADNRLVANLTVDELRNIIKTEILVNVLPYLNQTKIPNTNHGFFQTDTDIRTWMDPNNEPHKTWMQHKHEDTD